MAISVPPYMPMRQEVRPNIDIAGAIGGLGDALQQGMEFGQKRRVDKATRAALASGLTTGPDGLPDYMAAAGNILAGGGDTDTALTLARLAEAQNERNWQHNQPHYMDIGGNLYDTNSPAFRQATGGQSPAQPQADPADFGNPQQPPNQTDYQPPAPDQPAPGDTVSVDGNPYVVGSESPPDQTAQVEPQPIIRAPKKPPQRRTDIDADGNVVTTEAGEDGVWRVVSGPKKAAKGKAGGPTADQSKNRQIYTIVAPDLAIVDETFSALSDPSNQAAAALTPERFKNYTVTPEYQRALTALESIVRQSIYSESGATAPPEEVRGLALSMMPTLGEHSTSVADKKRRIHTMVESIKQRGNVSGSVENAAPAEPPDNAPEQINGKWYALDADGNLIEVPEP